MKFFTAGLGCIFLALADAQSYCTVYYTTTDSQYTTTFSPYRENIWGRNETVTESYIVKEDDFTIDWIDFDKDNDRLYYSTDSHEELRSFGLGGTGDDAILNVSTGEECSLRYGRFAVDPENGRFFGAGNHGDVCFGPYDGSSPLKKFVGARGRGLIQHFAYDPLAEKLYFTANAIWVAHIPESGTPQGDGAMVLYDTGPGFISGIDIDTTNGYVYWTNTVVNNGAVGIYDSPVGGIFRAPIDGSGPKEKLFSPVDFDFGCCRGLETIKIDISNQVLYFTNDISSIFVARADGRGKPKVLYDLSVRRVNDFVLDCDGSKHGLPLLAQCDNDNECFFGGICTGRVNKPKKCRFCARKNQVCDSDDQCCQSPSGRYCHPDLKVCKRRPKDDNLDFVQCPAGTAFSSLSNTGTRLPVSEQENIGHRDYVGEAIDLPFNFPWFGTTINRTFPAFNGVLATGIQDLSPGGLIGNFPSRFGTMPRISVYGGINYYYPGEVYMIQSSNSITFSWEDSAYEYCTSDFCSPSGAWNAQVTLFDNGSVTMCWGEMVGEGRNGGCCNDYYTNYHVVAGLEDDSLGYAKPAVTFPDNLFDESGTLANWRYTNLTVEMLSGRCACFG